MHTTHILKTYIMSFKNNSNITLGPTSHLYLPPPFWLSPPPHLPFSPLLTPTWLLRHSPPPLCRAVVLNPECSCPPGDFWRGLGACVVVTPQGRGAAEHSRQRPGRQLTGSMRGTESYPAPNVGSVAAVEAQYRDCSCPGVQELPQC